MSSFAPIRDEEGGIVGMQPNDGTLFARTLAETMTAMGATEHEDEPAAAPERARWRPGRLELVGMVCGLLLAVAAIAALNAFSPAPAPRTMPTALVAPTAAPSPRPTPQQQDAYAAPDGAQLGTIPLTATLAYQHSSYPGWGGVAWQGAIVWVEADPAQLAQLPDLAPPPTAAPRPPTLPAEPAAAPAAAPACDVTVNPAYVVKIAVLGPRGEPLGSATGVSCVSQDEAQANADALADQVRSRAATADAADAPTPTLDRSRR
jgi:hypothetical protein